MRRAVLLMIAACGGGGGSPPMPDATSDAPDAMTGYAACREFGMQTTFIPAHVLGTLTGSDVQAPSQCETIDAPFGMETSGPDAVVRIDGLTVGNSYVVRLSAMADLSFYVATGCSTPSGPSSDECLLFVDATSSPTNRQEVGRFTARGPSAYVVVDYYASMPTSTTFALDVYPESCTMDSQCSASLPMCANGHCVECVSSFDCKDPALPRCDSSALACVAGVDACASDDASEPEDDGPLGATQLVPGQTVTAHICSAQTDKEEADLYKFTVTTIGETWDFSLGWAGTHDLDLEVFDGNGAKLALSYHEQPEHARLSYLATGTYYVKVTDFTATQSPILITYTLGATRATGSGCSSRADCAAEYRNQLFRGVCQAGACISQQGNGAVTELGLCDSNSDCASGLSCSSFYFVANADTRDVCARSCSTDTDCAPLGNYVCTTYLPSNFCIQKCTADAQCPTALLSQPTSGPWYRLTCQLSTGRCTP